MASSRPKGKAVHGPPATTFETVSITDYGYPEKHMIAPHEVYKRRRAILEHLGATNGQDVIELLNGIADMYLTKSFGYIKKDLS